MAGLAAEISRMLAPYYSEMSLMLMATILVVYGDIINKYIKGVLSPCHFIVRAALFVVVCAFGYGFLTLYGAPFLHHVIAYLPWQYQGIGFIGAFLLVGILAEQRRYI
ncbi:DUF3392 family protein [Alteromonas halophila]|uniref:DUF3392 domain-containing protein n=1 Tax=Alteromonas halophila TaxID=516698 RepID=A0A918JKX1_9ALTE|nr:DUF3392 family protein [Alteromonas halophila]GGW83795.1 hypothetical protein GCM10007391_16740 [Alteromonas halophila]